MKKLMIFLLILGLIVGGVYIYMKQTGHSLASIMGSPETVGLNVSCPLNKKLLGTVADVKVTNLTNKEHKNIMITVTSYDSDGDVIEQEEVSFLRSLGPKKDMTKSVRLSKKTDKCECVVSNSEK
jgi:hypothetical protein